MCVCKPTNRSPKKGETIHLMFRGRYGDLEGSEEGCQLRSLSMAVETRVLMNKNC
jgi:hypothetical protein